MNCILAEETEVVGWSGRVTWAAGTEVKIVKLSQLDSGVVMVQKPEGGFRAWCSWDNLIPIEEED